MSSLTSLADAPHVCFFSKNIQKSSKSVRPAWSMTSLSDARAWSFHFPSIFKNDAVQICSILNHEQIWTRFESEIRAHVRYRVTSLRRPDRSAGRWNKLSDTFQMDQQLTWYMEETSAELPGLQVSALGLVTNEHIIYAVLTILSFGCIVYGLWARRVFRSLERCGFRNIDTATEWKWPIHLCIVAVILRNKNMCLGLRDYESYMIRPTIHYDYNPLLSIIRLGLYSIMIDNGYPLIIQ